MSGQGRPADTDSGRKPLQLSKRAFVLRRLMNLSTPLVIESREIETWSQALNSVLPTTREERASEHHVLRGSIREYWSRSGKRTISWEYFRLVQDVARFHTPMPIVNS